MKVLLAATCAVIILASAYFVWRDLDNQGIARAAAEQQVATAAAQAEAEKADQLAELDRINAQLRLACLQMRDDLATVVTGRSLGRRFVQVDARASLRVCLERGLLEQQEVNGLGV